MKPFIKLFPISLSLLAVSCSGFGDIFNFDENVKVTGVSFSQSSYSIYQNKSLKLEPTILPSNATNKSLTWSSSDSSILTVNNKGVVSLGSSAQADSSATITATTVDGGYTATCNVVVKEGSAVADWTILVYMCGANLESDYANETTITDDYGRSQAWNGMGLATMDISEILSVPNKPDGVNIVFETGGAKEWTTAQYGKYGSYNINAEKLQRHHVENGKLVLDETLTYYASMGLTSTLQSFIQYGLDTYPAEKTGVILWNHGGGLQGVCFDEKRSNDGLEVDEIISATSGALSAAGMSGEKLEFIGFDACLMQIQDIAIRCADYYNYMVGSQELESGYGWDYDTWLDDLYAGKSTPTILTALVDGFIKENGGTDDTYNDQTLSYLNLSYASAYKTAWENMAAQLKNKLTSSNSSNFISMIKSCKYYAEEAGYGAYGLFDAKTFINKLASTSNSYKINSSYTTAVINVFNNFVGHSSCGKAAGTSSGLSMYFPVDDGQYCSSDYNYYRINSETTLSNWLYIVDTYGETSSGGWWW